MKHIQDRYLRKLDIEDIKLFIQQQTPATKIYFGSDSERIYESGLPYVDYTSVIAVHFNGNEGAKLFGQVIRRRDFQHNLTKPKQRIMQEVFDVAELYLSLADVLEDRSVSIHLDINASKMFGSNSAMSDALSYIKGVTGLDPVLKPDAFCASSAADRFKGLR